MNGEKINIGWKRIGLACKRHGGFTNERTSSNSSKANDLPERIETKKWHSKFYQKDQMERETQCFRRTQC
jgi:hypothetical protein